MSAIAVKARGTGALLLGATLLGFSAIFVKWSVAGGASVLTVGLYRMLIALPGAWLLARKDGHLGARAGRLWAAGAGVAFFLDLALWHESMHQTTAANATLLVGLSPIWVALFAVAFLGRRLGWLAWLGQLV